MNPTPAESPFTITTVAPAPDPITKLLLAPSDPAVPGAGSVRIALFKLASFTVPPLRVSALMEV